MSQYRRVISYKLNFFLRQVGTYRYMTRQNMEKTVPVAFLTN